MSKIKIRYRKWKKTRVLHWNPHNWDAEPGDLMCGFGKLYRLKESNGCCKASAGELLAIEIKSPFKDGKAIIEDDEIYWIDHESWMENKGEAGKEEL